MPALPRSVRAHLLKRFELYTAALAAVFTAASAAVLLTDPPGVVVYAVAVFGVSAIITRSSGPTASARSGSGPRPSPRSARR